MKGRVIILLVTLLSTPMVWSMTLKANITGQKIEWKEVQSLGGDVFTPSFWHVVNGLRPTQEWVPGGLISPSPSEVRLSSGGDVVSMPLNISGYEYNTGSVSPNIGGSQSGMLCSGHINGGIVQVTGEAGCLFANSLVMNEVYTPYSFIRPLINIDERALLKAFEGKPAGRYIGSMAVGSFYDYYQSSVRTRYHDNYQIRFEFEYEPAFVFAVDITGNAELTTRYGVGTGRVSGETVFDGRASGWFTDGVTMTLNRARVDYQMKGPKLTTLPYSIECLECDIPRLVSEGVVQNLRGTVPGSQTGEIPFRLRVSFDEVPLSTLEDGRYSDTFYLLFEPGV